MKKWLRRKVNNRKIGDQHRDAGRWKDAAQAYTRHLARRSDDAAIWVQLGHALKEVGELDEAIEAYERADRLEPGNADTLLQLGHGLKLQGNLLGAMEAYQKSLSVVDEDKVWDELLSVRERAEMSSITINGEVTFYSVQDMFGYLKAHLTMSGIQRVQAGIAAHLIASEAPEVEFILSGTGGNLSSGGFWRLRKADLANIIDYASGADVSREKLDRLIATAERRAEHVTPVRGQTIVILGAFWGHGNTVSSYIASKKAGVRVGVYVYDIIPITHPEYCDAELSRSFSTSFAEMCLVVDFILTISEYTATVVRTYLTENGGREVPIAAVPLAHSLTQHDAPSQQTWPVALRHLGGRAYVAYVSTIEGRKNHLYVLQAWQALLRQGVAMPDLVFVGRRGWRVGALQDLLEVTGNLNGKVHIVHDLSDAELNGIYKNALFTVFTSFVEGWGLPVGESLLHGTPCIASGTSSIPEVGGDFVDYIDPNNLSGGLEVFRRMVEDETYREARRENIGRNFVPRSWSDVTDNFVRQVDGFRKLPVSASAYPLLPEGVLLKPGGLADSRVRLPNYVKRPLGLIVAQSFYPPERFGAWMKGRRGDIAFETGLPEGTEVVVYLAFSMASWGEGLSMSLALEASVRSDLRQFTAAELFSGRPVMVPGCVGQGGVCRILIETAGDYKMPASDHRDFVLGLISIAFARVASLEARLHIMEQHGFGDSRSVMDG